MKETLLYILFGVSIPIKILALFLLIFGVLPMMKAELKVKNGLKWLRRSLFAIGVLLIIVNLIALILIICGFVGADFLIFGGWIAFVNALTNLLIAGILYLIYNHKRK